MQVGYINYDRKTKRRAFAARRVVDVINGGLDGT
jgi:hypothetical protein